RGMTGTHYQSLFVAALFALHPLHVESVAWISERKDVLSTFFFFLTLAAYLGYTQNSAAKSQKSKSSQKGALAISTGSGQSLKAMSLSSNFNSLAVAVGYMRSRVGFYLLALVFFALGLMSKPMLVTVPFVLLLLDFWPLRRFEFTETGLQQQKLLPVIIEKIPFLVLSCLSSVVTYLVQKTSGAVSTRFSIDQRLSNALIAYGQYIGKLVWPENLAVFYPHPSHW